MLSARDLRTTEFVAVDLETTGCRPGRNSVLEVGAVRFNATDIIGTFAHLVRPADVIPRAVEELTGITTGMVATAPPVEEAIRGFRAFSDGAVLVAHNYRFDLSFLDFEAERVLGAPFDRPVIDTLYLLRRLHPGLTRYSLGSLATEFELPTRPDHRAGNDARTTAELLQHVLPHLLRLGMSTAGDVVAFSGLSGQQALADRLRLTRGIPDEPGVYLFRDSEGRVIFVGHARSLRTRTRQYFYPGAATDALAHDVAAITAVRTPSHLDALLLEHRLVDRHHPRYNPAAHRSRTAYLIKADTSAPFSGLRLVEVPRERGRLLGPFTSKWAASTLLERLEVVYGLRRCSHRLDARLAMTPCAHRQNGSCPAPCVSEIDAVGYADRLDRALAVLDDDTDLRRRLAEGQRSAATAGQYEEAIRNRDGLRALDRATSTHALIRHAAQQDVVLVEEFDGLAVVSFVRGGLRAAVLRGARDTIAAKVGPTLDRVYFSGAAATEPSGLTASKLAELVTIASFDESDAHLEIPVTSRDDTTTRVRRALGLERRIPRRRHGAVSAG